jgi:AraC-like DNA-binding protein
MPEFARFDQKVERFLRISGNPETRLGRIWTAGDVTNEQPLMPSELRILDYWVLLILISGRGWYKDANNQNTLISAGDFVLIEPRLAHSYGVEPAEVWSESFFVFEGPLMDGLSKSDILKPGIYKLANLGSVKTLRNQTVSNAITIKESERQILAVVQWLIESTFRADNKNIDSSLTDQIKAASNLFLENLPNSVHLVEKIAKEVGIPYDVFRKEFKKVFGVSPGSWIRQQRLIRVAQLLSFTDIPIKVIARRFGFSDEFHLSKSFTKFYGVAPGIYRTNSRM